MGDIGRLKSWTHPLRRFTKETAHLDGMMMYVPQKDCFPTLASIWEIYKEYMCFVWFRIPPLAWNSDDVDVL
jgi:hypothetical protein